MMLIRYRTPLRLRGQAGFGAICTLLEDLERLIRMETSRRVGWWLWYIEIEV
jgi:hypothetical protein